MSLSPETLLQRLHLDTLTGGDGPLAARSPIDGAVLARLPVETAADADRIVAQAHTAFQHWRTVPAPRRGELVRLLGEELRAHKAERWSRWKPARSRRRAWAKCRR